MKKVIVLILIFLVNFIPLISQIQSVSYNDKEFIVNYDSIAASLSKNGWEKLTSIEKKDRINSFREWIKKERVQGDNSDKDFSKILIKMMLLRLE